MKKDYNFSKMKSRKNPYAQVLRDSGNKKHGEDVTVTSKKFQKKPELLGKD